MNWIEVSIAVDLITEVEGEKPIFGFEFHQITTAITKFRDFMLEHYTTYLVPYDKLQELSSYIAKFPTIKFGDIDNARYQNDVVEALRVICEISASAPDPVGHLLYHQYEWLSPSLQKYYSSYFDGHQAEYQTAWPSHGLTRVVTKNHWYMRTHTLFFEWMGSMEAWFLLDKHYNNAKVSWAGGLNLNPNNKAVIRIVLVKSGVPHFEGAMHVNDRGDVVKLGTHDWNGTMGYLSGEHTFVVNDDVKYLVACIMDDDPVWYREFHLSKLSIEGVS